jgi:hypothetical protein
LKAIDAPSSASPYFNDFAFAAVRLLAETIKTADEVEELVAEFEAHKAKGITDEAHREDYVPRRSAAFFGDYNGHPAIFLNTYEWDNRIWYPLHVVHPDYLYFTMTHGLNTGVIHDINRLVAAVLARLEYPRGVRRAC